MKALFIHDHIFIKNSNTGTLFTSGNLNSAIWERYLVHFDSLTVIGRCKEEIETSKYNEAEKKRVSFKLFDNVKGGIDYFIKYESIKRALKKEIRAHDIVIMRFPATISIFAANFCVKNKISYVSEVVGCSWDANWNYGGIPAKLMAPYSFINMKKAVKNASATIYVTQKFLQKRYPTDASITAEASNVNIKRIEENVLLNRLNRIKKNTLVWRLGIIGNIAVKYKGYDVLLKAVSSLPKPYRQKIKISFVGGGDSTYLQSLIKKYKINEQVEILGKLKAGQEIFNFLDNLDIYVHPSKQEGLPRVVIEAMSRACPVLASGVAGTPELIDQKYIHQPGNCNRLKKTLIEVMENKDELSQMAKQNFNTSKNYLFDNLEMSRNHFFNSVKQHFSTE